MEKKTGIFIFLHFNIMIYTLSGIVGKIASSENILSTRFIFLYGIEIIILGIYAILWQQVISRMDLSIAYANKSVTLLWSLIWGSFIFHEKFTLCNVIGIIIVIVGILLINTDSSSKESET